MPKDHRIHSLDTLRGLAAVSVVFLHILSVYGTKESWAVSAARGNFIAFLLTRTPVGIFFAGNAAVILFFILSGFVLSLPFLSGHSQSYRTFLVRRICRIYLPYAAALFIAIGVRHATGVEPDIGATSITPLWLAPPSFGEIAGYLAMTGFSYHTRFDWVVWSLIHEMRISLIFPLLLATTSRGWLWLKLLAFFVFSFVCAWFAINSERGTSIDQLTIRSALQTGSYIWFFVVGIELARHRRVITAWIASCPRIGVVALLFLAACLYCAHSLIPALSGAPELDFVVGVGATGFITLAIGRARFDRWLTWEPCLFLGLISYSLYLFHPIVLLGSVYAFHSILSPAITQIVVAPTSVVAAWAGRRLIEDPSIQLGRFLTRSKVGLAAN